MSENPAGNGNGDRAQGLEFPCRYPIKAMGRTGEGLSEAVVGIIADHVTVAESDVRSRPSSAGRFESITVTVDVETREQLEAIYADLGKHEQVLWTL